jgi:succinate-semialdehyde dehydrogenase/glutarate-semialdehyde dehydrogenase
VAIATINPSTDETVRTFDELTDAQIDEKLQRAVETFRGYRRSTIATRAAAMLRAADILEAEQEALGRVMTLEMGKLAKAGREEALKCAWGCRFYAERAAVLLADTPVPTAVAESFIRYQPLGAILAVMPWNFPFWQVFRLAAPALMAGNVVLLKHASNVPQCALLIEDIFRRAGFPEGAFQTLLIEVAQLPRVLEDPRVAAVSLTGSEFAGMEVASRAGRHLKKAVLELGGSDPFIVMPSADLAAAVETGVKSRIVNNGQSCIAAKRFIVAEPVADAFERAFTERMQALRVGDPLDQRTELGPLAHRRVLTDLHEQVQRSIAAGARLLTGGAPLDRPGAFYPPTVLTDIPTDSPAYHEELFGPVAALFRVPDIDAAIALANDTRFGLGCSVWTRDPEERARFIEEIEAGQVFVNSMVASDPRLPFGGIKRSGYGRELGEWGMREFVNVKTISINDRAAAAAPAADDQPRKA